jgi:hypothetical protein
LFELAAGACRWPSRHDLDDPRFSWCAEPTLPGGPYCAVHTDASRNHHDQPGIVFAIERTGMAGRVGRLPGVGKDERYRTTGRDDDVHVRAALGSADAGRPGW